MSKLLLTEVCSFLCCIVTVTYKIIFYPPTHIIHDSCYTVYIVLTHYILRIICCTVYTVDPVLVATCVTKEGLRPSLHAETVEQLKDNCIARSKPCLSTNHPWGDYSNYLYSIKLLDLFNSLLLYWFSYIAKLFWSVNGVPNCQVWLTNAPNVSAYCFCTTPCHSVMIEI